MLNALLASLEQTGLVRTIATSSNLYAFVSGLHILGLGSAIGATVLLDVGVLRGHAMESRALDVGARKMAIAGLSVAFMTGFVLFACRATEYLENGAFIAKLVVIGLAMINVVAFHRCFARRPLLRVASAACSIVFWISALFLGRWIAFNIG